MFHPEAIMKDYCYCTLGPALKEPSFCEDVCSYQFINLDCWTSVVCRESIITKISELSEETILLVFSSSVPSQNIDF